MPKNRMRPIHPGEILREEYLAPLGMSALEEAALESALWNPGPSGSLVVFAQPELPGLQLLQDRAFERFARRARRVGFAEVDLA